MKTMLLAGAAALALCVSGGAQAAQQPMMNAGGVRGTAHPVHHGPSNGFNALYDQNFASGAYGFFSQTLSSYPQYDEYLADDFTVPAGHNWKVKEVDVTGFYYIETGPATSVNVLFWRSKPADLPRPRTPKAECDNIMPTSGISTGVFVIRLPATCLVKLKGGTAGTTYWMTVQANLAGPFTSGYWAWSSNATVNGNMASAYDYGGSVTTNDPRCYVKFESINDCYGDGAIDLAFALYGTDNS
ncbi:MAG TPA: hypothetical protein VKR31_10600 [Rhizomicrobium sp.]|nr:hypothetical protein [Rhizomicrobium sp.]